MTVKILQSKDKKSWTIYHHSRYKGNIHGTNPKKQVQFFKENKGDFCYICKQKSHEYDIEHVIPITVCGDDTIINKELCCGLCHRRKTLQDVLIIASLKKLFIIEGSQGVHTIHFSPVEMKEMYVKLKYWMDVSTEGYFDKRNE